MRNIVVDSLDSQRLSIEFLRAGHASMVLESSPATVIYTYLPEDPPTAEALQRRYEFLEGGRSPDGHELWLNWVAFLRDSKTPVGTFQATLPKDAPGAFAYVIFPPFWRQGFGRELAALDVFKGGTSDEHTYSVHRERWRRLSSESP